MGYNQGGKASDERVIYVTVVGQSIEESDTDLRVERSASDASKFTITDLSSGESSEVDLSSFSYEHNSLIKMETESASVGSQTF